LELFTDDQLNNELSGQDYLLYSIGANGTDDKGDPNDRWH